MLAVVPGVAQHPAFAGFIRHDERIPVHEIGLLLGVAVDLRAHFIGVGVCLHLRQDESVLHRDGDRPAGRQGLGQGDRPFLTVKRVVADRLVIDAQRFDREPSAPEVRLDGEHEFVERFTGPVGVGDGLGHGANTGREVEAQIHHVFRARQRGSRGGGGSRRLGREGSLGGGRSDRRRRGLRRDGRRRGGGGTGGDEQKKEQRGKKEAGCGFLRHGGILTEKRLFLWKRGNLLESSARGSEKYYLPAFVIASAPRCHEAIFYFLSAGLYP